MSRSSGDSEALKSAMRGEDIATCSSQHAPPLTKDIPIASPSASILLISSTNRILLLHRVKTSTSFPSAHVFAGGHLSAQDGPLPPIEDARRHEDNETYRSAAIRECFEESGLLLAKRENGTGTGELVQLSEQERDDGRKAVHSETVMFREWVKQRGAEIDLEGLVPFTRWLTPSDVPKRFSTQMYLYFLPNDSPSSSGNQSTQMHIPTPDGGIEHTAASFLYPQQWIDMFLKGEIVLFPPQFFLLSIIAPFLCQPAENRQHDNEALEKQRTDLMHFVQADGDPPWGEKCISPNTVRKTDDYLIMGMAEPGPELIGTERKGDRDRVLKVVLAKEIERGRRRPSPQRVLWRRDVLHEEAKLRGKV